MNLLRFSITAILAAFSLNGWCWNAVGHKLVAQIAYHHLTPEAKKKCNQYNHSLDPIYKPASLVNAAPWMDGLRYMHQLWLKEFHYIDIPYSSDGTQVNDPNPTNAVTAIESAKKILADKTSSDFDKGFNLRILLHVVGDLHQPLHAVSQYSARHPHGDMGGNLVVLSSNSVGNNLHSYWDNGGGLFSGAFTTKRINSKARQIEQHWPCDTASMSLDQKIWSEESHQLALSKVYQIKEGSKPDKNYQLMTKEISEKRVAQAGCRLAALLNTLVAQHPS